MNLRNTFRHVEDCGKSIPLRETSHLIVRLFQSKQGFSQKTLRNTFRHVDDLGKAIPIGETSHLPSKQGLSQRTLRNTFRHVDDCGKAIPLGETSHLTGFFRPRRFSHKSNVNKLRRFVMLTIVAKPSLWERNPTFRPSRVSHRRPCVKLPIPTIFKHYTITNRQPLR
jgi:hypothetical protein